MGRLQALTSRFCPPERTRAADMGILALRLGAGGLLAGHGAQKLFGAFGGHGLEGTAGWLESMGFRPAKAWATLAGLSEFGGGALTALGLGGPLGPIVMQGSMATAIRKVHWGKPIWNSEGGAELPALYSLTGLAVGLAGPGRYSLDHAFRVRIPPALPILAGAGVLAGVALGEWRSRRRPADVETAKDVEAAQSPESEDRLIEGGSSSDQAEEAQASQERLIADEHAPSAGHDEATDHDLSAR